MRSVDQVDPLSEAAIGVAYRPGTTSYLILDFRASETGVGIYQSEYAEALTLPITFDGPYWAVTATFTADNLAMIAIPGEEPIFIQFDNDDPRN